MNYSIANIRFQTNNVGKSSAFRAALKPSRINPVATSSPLRAGGIIESATALFGSSQPKRFRATNIAKLQLDSEYGKQERAMARRLAQLHAALGEAEASPVKVAAIEKPQATARDGKSLGMGSYILTSLLSALFGAGVMWLATHHEQTPVTPSPAIHVAVPAPIASVPAVSAEPPPITPAAPVLSDEQRISELLEIWRRAWAQRDIGSYLNAYSQQFSPTDGSSRDAWIAARTKKLSAGAPIDIQIRDLAIERIEADLYKATFRQDYASGSYRETGRIKTLQIAREGGEWRIRQERLE